MERLVQLVLVSRTKTDPRLARRMKILVIGATISTKRILNDLLKHREHEVAAIVTLVPELAARKARFVTLDDVAVANGIELTQVRRISDPDIFGSITNLNPDLIIESGWSQIIPKSILAVPRYGCVGLHYGWLPDYRGGASLNWALIRGEKIWGVSLFYLVERVDEGGIIDRRRFAIEDRDDIRIIYDKADSLAIQMINDNLPAIAAGASDVIQQSKNEGVRLERRRPKDGEIDWTQSATTIHNLIRASTRPYPGAYTTFMNRKLIIWESQVVNNRSGPPGSVMEIADGQGIIVGAGSGSLLIVRAQIEGQIEQWGDELAHNLNLKQGDPIG